jgi:hypothetical protein
MGNLDFHLEFYAEVPHLEEGIKQECDDRLWALTEGRKDMVGASVAVEEIAGKESTFLYQARIVVYIKPENISVVEKAENPELAVKQALSAVEQRVREVRSKIRKPWKRPDQAASAPIFELSAGEVYATYAGQADPAELISQGRADIAADLMLNENLDKETAYYAADQILEFAQESINAEGA